MDISLDAVTEYTIKSVVESDPSMRDFYDTYDSNEATEDDRKAYNSYLSTLSPAQKATLTSIQCRVSNC